MRSDSTEALNEGILIGSEICGFLGELAGSRVKATLSGWKEMDADEMRRAQGEVEINLNWRF